MEDLSGVYVSHSGDEEADSIERVVRADPQVPGNYLVDYRDPETHAVLYRGFDMGQRCIEHYLEEGFWTPVEDAS